MSNDITMTDKTGQPRSIEELKQARTAIEAEIVKMNVSNPALFIHFMTIRDALSELIWIRERMARAKEIKEQNSAETSLTMGIPSIIKLYEAEEERRSRGS